MSSPVSSPASPPFADLPRKDVIAGSVNADEKARVLSALDQAGFRNQSEGVREVMLAFTGSAEIRDAVRRHLRASS